MDTKQAERAIIAGLEELGWATKVGLAELDGVHGKVNVALKRLITAGKVVRAKAGIAARRLPCVESADCVRDSAKDMTPPNYDESRVTKVAPMGERVLVHAEYTEREFEKEQEAKKQAA